MQRTGGSRCSPQPLTASVRLPTTMQSGLNCHFVSRFLTRPWEYGQRQLSYFDFDQGDVRSCSSRSLFAVTGTNTNDVETRLNQVIETPISSAMARLVDMEAESEELLEWPLFRALSLLLMLQPLRSRSSEHHEHAERLEETVTRSDAELDELTKDAQAAYWLGRISVRSDAPLLYPVSGFFPLVAKRRDGSYGSAIAIPASKRHVFVAVPRSFDWGSSMAQWSANGAGFVANVSVGTGSRVVIPPSAMVGLQREQVVALIHQMRAASKQMINLCQDFNTALARLNTECGLS